jgi:hypothetical protein
MHHHPPFLYYTVVLFKLVSKVNGKKLNEQFPKRHTKV